MEISTRAPGPLLAPMRTAKGSRRGHLSCLFTACALVETIRTGLRSSSSCQGEG